MSDRFSITLSAEGREDITISVDDPAVNRGEKSSSINTLMDCIATNLVVGEAVRVEFHFNTKKRT